MGSGGGAAGAQVPNVETPSPPPNQSVNPDYLDCIPTYTWTS